MKDNNPNIDATTKLIDKNEKNNKSPDQSLSELYGFEVVSLDEFNINNESTLLNNQKVNHANVAINPKFFKDKKVLNEFDLENDVYKRESGNKIEERIIKLTTGAVACMRIGIGIVTSVIVLIGLVILANVTQNGVFLYFIPIPFASFIVLFFLTSCFKTITPNNALVLTYYGKYIGTSKESGMFWIRPFTNIETVCLKSNQYNGNMLKVNDKTGTPMKLGLVAVWKVRDTAKVIFGVNNYFHFVETQTESAVRFVGCKYPYESRNENEPCLKEGSEEINQILKLELERRVKIAGIEIEDARITEISYGDEIAAAMLEKQTSEIKVMAKEKIALGAVDVIERSIKEVERRTVCELTNEERVKLVSNMMLILNTNSNNGNNMIKLNI